MLDNKTRTILKTTSWRILATTDTFIISWFITGKLSWAGAIAGIEVFTKMFLYYGHERVWNRVSFGRMALNPTINKEDFNAVIPSYPMNSSQRKKSTRKNPDKKV